MLAWLVLVGYVGRDGGGTGTSSGDHVGVQAHDQSGPPCLPLHRLPFLLLPIGWACPLRWHPTTAVTCSTPSPRSPTHATDSEVQQLVDHVVIISQGRLVRQGTLAELADLRAGVSVHTPQAAELRAALQRATANGARIEQTGPDSLRVTGIAPAEVGHLACVEGLELHQLTPQRGDLEQVFFALTAQPSQNQEPAHLFEEVR